jgi:hypothetical protein
VCVWGGFHGVSTLNVYADRSETHSRHRPSAAALKRRRSRRKTPCETAHLGHSIRKLNKQRESTAATILRCSACCASQRSKNVTSQIQHKQKGRERGRQQRTQRIYFRRIVESYAVCSWEGVRGDGVHHEGPKGEKKEEVLMGGRRRVLGFRAVN